MRKNILLALFTFFIVTGIIAQDDIKKSVDLKVSDFIAVPEFQADIKDGKQPISTKKDVEKFIELVNTKFGEQGGNEMGEISAWINKNLSFTNNNVEFNDNVGIVFLHHDLNVDKLKRADEEKRKTLRCDLFDMKAEIEILKKHEKDLEGKMRLNKQLIQSEFLYYLLDIHENLNKKLSETQQKFDSESSNRSVFSDVVLKRDGTLESAEEVKLSFDKKEKLIESISNLSVSTREKNQLIAAIKKAKNESDVIKNSNVQKIINQRIGQTKPLVKLNLDMIKLINSLRERRREKEEQFEKLKAEYLLLFNVFEEKEGVSNYLLHQGTKKIEYTEYMLETREFLVIIFGGKEDIANAEIQIENKKSAFSTSADNLLKVVKQLGIGEIDVANYLKLENFALEDQTCEKVVEDPEESSMQVSFILVSMDKIKPPSTLKITHESIPEISYEIHEKVRAQLRVGISGANLDRKDFFIDPTSGNFVVQPDSTQANEWKSNGYALIEIYPFGGRDIDRFESIFKKNNQTSVWDRFSLALGLKLSSDPLEAIYTGASFSVDRSTSITAGLSFQSTADNTPTGGVLNSANATIEYLQNNVDREYVPKFFIGLSISPGRFGEIIGSGE